MLKIGRESPYGVIVCGAGHAGCEAALASARMGVSTLLITGNLDTIAQMSCNPAIGGLAKGHIVREIDALGGEMAVNADATALQFRVLNASKGLAVQGPRAQCDKKAYQFRMKRVLESAENLSVFQAEVVRLIVENGTIRGVGVNLGAEFYAETVIVTTGTFLKGLMHVGGAKTEGGRMGDFSSRKLSASLEECGIKLGRLKTGTPARILGKSIDFSKCVPQRGDEDPQLFAFYDTRVSDFSSEAERAIIFEKKGIFLPKNEGKHPRKGVKRVLGAKECEIEAVVQKCNFWEPENGSEKGQEGFGEKMFHVEHSEPGSGENSVHGEGKNLLKTLDSCSSFVNPSTGLPYGEDSEGRNFSSIPESGEWKRAYESEFEKMSFGNFDGFGKSQLLCYEVHTNERTKEIILKNLGRSAMYGGEIKGVGPRYCPSIEDKVVRFTSHETHRLFLEPEGRFTDEWYINGLSTSMPLDVQLEIIRSIEGLENAEIARPAYAVEYDYAPPTQIFSTLESKIVRNLFFAGQINGTSGYEEAAGQGLVAGINAAARVLGLEPLVLPRHESYIGVLIDDLVTKGTKEPYRMFTSRAEYRLLLNHQSADIRLFKYAKRYGLLGAEREGAVARKKEAIDAWTRALSAGGASRILRRSGGIVSFGDLPEELAVLSRDARNEILYRAVFGGYLERDLRQIEKMKDVEDVVVPEEMDFQNLKGLRIEASQKFAKVRPRTVGQASRISGVSPADIGVLLVHIKSFRKR